MKLFIWSRPYHVPFGSSMYFAVADTLEEAKALAPDSVRYSFGEFEKGIGAGTITLGDPTRVLSLPNGEWHEWQE